MCKSKPMLQRMVIACFALVLLVAGSAARAEDMSATAVVEALHGDLVTMMKDAEALGFEGRSQYMEPVVARSFEMPVIAAMVSGRNWQKFDKDQKTQLIVALRRLNVATYAGRFNGYSGEVFVTLSEEPAEQDLRFVNTELQTSDGGVISLKYLMYPGKSGWRIIDVYFLGIYSEVSMRRSEYTSVYMRDGFDGLLAAIDQKSADYAAGLAQ
jgi:phospholipid transport system substrate-binding protein